ncbi:deoxyribodipyrimidine photo-lyase [Vibrio sp. 99-70-13A1]|uniref:deoxyribodipyrimidine photo-lyase n=1 Tax=Vibrio sp. 99-70-13A1 TaxID=2607601 RepID=UPI001493675F|nr:deoxyribodipyrimidine photo-lyase [Vibrio sp. 99-70-13A1]NOH95981.1 deoxyribodipyrimidine photo-lyase [Vibrio sp. 99-70-13A1]
MNNILWIRRDLRTHDNPALVAAIENGATRAVFISTPLQWKQHHLAPIKADLMCRHLQQLSEQLHELGIALTHINATDFADQITQLKTFCSDNNIGRIFANTEPECDEVNRDKQVIEQGLHLEIFQSDTIVPLGKVLNKQGEMFKVFTPFKNAWLKRVQQTGIECSPSPSSRSNPVIHNANTHEINEASSPSHINSESRWDIDYPRQSSDRWPLSEKIIEHVIPDFLANKVSSYHGNRDIPSIKGTSGLSPYLAIGAISPRWLAIQLIQQNPDVLFDTQHSAFSWLNELIWRDFYKHLLFHYPQLAKGNNFQTKYDGLMWHPDHQSFKAWCEGKTGYPIVDAAMRQLTTTGWMHNRLRMIVASFLTKHLLIDWRWGEHFFMSHLIDGDFSANNGGWQWAASTGCDAQPYFRIFNPITQSERFDPKGIFIRRYLPELADLPDKDIHFPHDYLKKHPDQDQYWAPIVEHKQARLRALAFFK